MMCLESFGWFYPSSKKTGSTGRWEHLKNPSASPPSPQNWVFSSFFHSWVWKTSLRTSAPLLMGLEQWVRCCPTGEKKKHPIAHSQSHMCSVGPLRRASPSIPVLQYLQYCSVTGFEAVENLWGFYPPPGSGGCFWGASPASPGCSRCPAPGGKRAPRSAAPVPPSTAADLLRHPHRGWGEKRKRGIFIYFFPPSCDKALNLLWGCGVLAAPGGK